MKCKLTTLLGDKKHANFRTHVINSVVCCSQSRFLSEFPKNIIYVCVCTVNSNFSPWIPLAAL